MSLRLFLSTGEVSGEQHAARLLAALQTERPDLRCAGMGSGILRAAGVEIVVDTAGHQVMGFVEVLKHLPHFWRAASRIVEHLASDPPDAVILVDNPGFHLRLARAIKKRLPDLPILYYIAPKAWAWQARRARVLRACVDQVLCIFPFEPAWFEARGVRAVYVGHPTVDAVRDAPDRAAARAAPGIPADARVLGVFPGSRPKEVERLLPVMLDTLATLHALELTVVLAAAPGFTRESLARIAPLPEAVRVVEGQSLAIMAASDALFAKSGTTTLEAALLGRPMVVVYRASWLTARLARALVDLPWFSLPNIIAGRQIIPEFFQEEIAIPRLAEEIRRLFADPDHVDAMQRALAELRQRFGDEPAAVHTAQAVLARLDARIASPREPTS